MPEVRSVRGIMETDNSLTINGHEYSIQEGDTILDVARRNDVSIPTLCHLEGAIHTGACRVCLVEVEGARGLAASCAMPAGPGMKVLTESPKVIEARRFVIALLMVSGNHNCAVRGVSDDDWTDFQLGVRGYDQATDICDAYGVCELQALAYRYQVGELVSELRLRSLDTSYPLEEASPFILRDFSRCILCGRCVKACNEIRYHGAISYGYRGAEAKIVTRGDNPLAESDCVFCGECIQVCPVGALVEKENRYEARPWELNRVSSTCGYCGTGCSVDFFVKEGRIVRAAGTESGPVNRGSLCIRGRYGHDSIHHPDRLSRPLIREGGEVRPADWGQALDFVAGKLREIRDAHGPEAIAAFCSTRISNEDSYVMQKFFRICVGTNSVDNASRLVDLPTVVGLEAAFGVPAMTNSIDEIDATDLVLLTGSDITRDHPVVASRMRRAVKKLGAALLVVDPGDSDMAELADMHLQPRPGTDVAWLNGFAHVILEEGLFDAGLASGVAGFAQLKEVVARYTPEYVETITGIPQARLVEAARLYAGAQKASVYYGNGITQQVAGTDNVMALANLARLCGNIGLEGGGLNPLRTQCNAQGVCDMGCLPSFFPGYAEVDEQASSALGAQWGGQPPATAGLSFPEVLRAIGEGKIKALYVVGEDPLSTLPDPSGVELTLEQLELLVVQDIFPSELGKIAHAVLPAASFAEKEGTFTNMERRIQRIRKAVEAPGEAKEDWRILAELSSRLGQALKYESSSAVFEEIARTIPGYSGISYSRLENEGGLQWPCPAADHPGTGTLFKDEPLGSGAGFQAVDYAAPAEAPDVRYPYLLIAGGVLDHCFRWSSVGEHLSANALEISAQDAMKLGLRDNDKVKVTSRRGAVEVPVRIGGRFPKGVVYAPLHFAGAGLTRLLGTAGDSKAGIPPYKSCAVRMQVSRGFSPPAAR